MTWFIDRRLNGKNKSAVNRQRFLRRYKAQIKQSISEAINKRSVTDIESGESVSIPTDDINEPMFHQGRGGLRNRVHPGQRPFLCKTTALSARRAVAAAAVAVRGKPAPMVKERMSLSSRSRKMNTWICYLKIWPCRT